jgi:MoxR-like ATPase
VPFLNREEMNQVLSRTILQEPIEVKKVIGGERIVHLRKILNKVVVADPVRDYAARLVLASHPESEFAPEKVKLFVRWGASPRAAQALLRAARVRALAEGRVHLAFEDIRAYTVEVLQHRVILNYDGQAENVRVADLVKDIHEHIPEQG